MNDFDKICRAWQSLLARQRVDIQFETACMIFRYAGYGRLVSPDPKPPDTRQNTLELRGGSMRKSNVVTWTVS
jgi:hypothetical protein